MSEPDTFCFLVLDPQGKRVRKEVAAASFGEARLKLQKENLIPLKPLNRSNSAAPSFFSRRKGKFDVLSFTNRLAPLLEANVPLEKALAVLEDGMTDPFSKEILFDLRKKLHEGRRFSELIRESPGNFPEIYAGLVEAGEESGNLPQVIGELRKFLSESKEFRDFVVTSSIYPASVVIVTVAVVLLLFTVFIPRFAKVFADMGQSLPLLTQIMLDASSFIVRYWGILLVPFFVWILLKIMRRKSDSFRRKTDKLLLKIPFFGPLSVSIQIGNFMRSMAIMACSHVHLLNCLKVSVRLLTNREVRASFDDVAERLRGGGKISEILGTVPYLPPGSAAMLKVAEESGEVGEMFARIAEEQQNSAKLKFKRMMVMLEPIIIIVLAVMVMLVVLAVFTAIWKMNSLR